MKFPPTSSVQLPSLFDLLAPAASPGGNGQSIFDTLLQPPAPAAPPPPPPPSGSGLPMSPPRASQPKHPDDEGSPSAAPSADASSADHRQRQQQPEASANCPPPANPPAAADGKTQDKAEPPAQDNITAESLAGMAAVQPATAAPQKPASAEAGSASTSETGTTAKTKAAAAAQANQAAPSGEPTTTPPAAATDQAAATNENAGAEKKPLTADPQALGTTGHARPAAQNAGTVQTDKPAVEPASDAAASILPEADGKTADNQPANHHSNQPQSLATPPAQPAAIDPTTTPPPANPATPVIASVAAALPAPAAGADQAATARAQSSTTAPLGATTAPRSRLPGEVLAQSPRAAARTAPTEADTARLLSRVAKAFNAAQERDGEVRLRLSPPELGALRLEVRVQDGAVVAHVQTETDSARTALIDNLPALRDRLADQGMRIERFDVDLMQRQPGGSPDQPGGRQPDVPVPMRLAPPPKAQATAASAPLGPAPASTAASGLNIII